MLDVGLLNIVGLATRAGLDSTDGDSPDDDRGVFVDQTVVISELFFALSVGDLQVAVRGSELLSAHDQPLQLLQGDVRAVKHHGVVAQFGGEFIMNMRHVDAETENC